MSSNIKNNDQMIILKNIHSLATPSKIINDCSLIIEKGIITHLIQDENIKDFVNISDYEVINCNDQLVVPGFIDPHTHPVFAGDRAFELELKIKGMSYLEIQKQGGGINYTVNKTRDADKDSLVSNLEKITQTMLMNGTTTMEAKTGYHLTVEGELLALEVIAEVNNESEMDLIPTFLGAHLIPSEYQKNPDEYVDLILDEMLPKVAKQGIAQFTDVFCDSGAFTLEQTIQIIERSLELNIPIRVHAEQFTRTGISTIAAESYNAYSADHLLQVTPGDLEILKKYDTTAIIIPNDPIVLFSKENPPYTIFNNYQGNLAIATDFNPNNWLTNMNLAIYLACYLWRLTPRQAIFAATLGAARSLGLKDRGVIQPGKKADLLIYNLPEIAYIPYYSGLVRPKFIIKNGKLFHH